MRIGQIERTTNETDITLTLNLDGSGQGTIRSGSGFFDHMLALFLRHSHFDLTLECKGDTPVDFHHSVEDIGICLGKAFLHALGDKKGICRYGSMLLPMDEALVLAALDISGRSYLAYDVEFPSQKVGEFDTELVREFFEAFVRNAGITLHLKKMAGANSHHIAEACFKSFAGVLKSAVSLDLNTDDIPSSKGIL